MYLYNSMIAGLFARISQQIQFVSFQSISVNQFENHTRSSQITKSHIQYFNTHVCWFFSSELRHPISFNSCCIFKVRFNFHSKNQYYKKKKLAMNDGSLGSSRVSPNTLYDREWPLQRFQIKDTLKTIILSQILIMSIYQTPSNVMFY